MKKLLLIALAGVQVIPAFCQAGATALIPVPLHVQENPGFFALQPATRIEAPVLFSGAATLLAEQFGLPVNAITATQKTTRKQRLIRFVQAADNDTLGHEGYRLSIQPARILVTAQSAAGALKAVGTLTQLQLLQKDESQIPCASITDKPRFEYRGMHLDVSRNFYPISFIKKYIDLMAIYKFNTFHWHLVDGAGWRLEIKKYPLLTSVAAFRPYADWKSWWKNGRQYAQEGLPEAYGGYYSQAQAKEMVAYAAARGITIIPEIEMPGHSEEVLAVYPQLSCSGMAYKNSEFCIGNEQTFEFLQNVLTETMAIFPAAYIHVGGDEASTAAWKNCPKCQQRKKDQGLSTEHELQSYCIKRIEKFLNAHGRKLLGWDEILEGGLAPGATVMSWRGEKGGIDAASRNHDVIMTPGECYLDAYQSNPNTEPEAIGGYLPLQRVYQYEPVPAVLPAEKTKYIKGVQANVWTEYMPTTYQVEYMAYPRAIALAETGWSLKEKKNFDDFQQRLQHHYLLLQKKLVNYYRPSAQLTMYTSPDTIKKQQLISFASEQYKPTIRYTTDGSIPLANSTLYQQPFYATGKTIISATIFKNGKALAAPLVQMSNYHKAIGKKTIFNTAWSDAYPAQQASTLTNGIEGSLTYSDKQWLGYLNSLDITIDMDSVTAISSLSIRFMQQPGPGVFLPSFVEVFFSADGINFSPAGKQVNTILPSEPATIFKSFVFEWAPAPVRYIRIKAPNTQGGFMFTDEVIIY
jgi:hexosaminidase